jgi:hypothetical protein
LGQIATFITLHLYTKKDYKNEVYMSLVLANEPYGRAMARWKNGTVEERVDFDANKFEYYDNIGQLLNTRSAPPQY